MKPKILIGAVIAVAIIAVGAYFFMNSAQNDTNSYADENGEVPVAGVLAEENAIVVSEQQPGATVTASLAVLKAPGYVVIHEDAGGQPGAILGASALLAAGENPGVSITLSRQTRDGERLHAMLHAETDGNSSFDASTDAPVQSKLGGPISGWFEISSSASSDVPVSI